MTTANLTEAEPSIAELLNGLTPHQVTTFRRRLLEAAIAIREGLSRKPVDVLVPEDASYRAAVEKSIALEKSIAQLTTQRDELRAERNRTDIAVRGKQERLGERLVAHEDITDDVQYISSETVRISGLDTADEQLETKIATQQAELETTQRRLQIHTFETVHADNREHLIAAYALLFEAQHELATFRRADKPRDYEASPSAELTINAYEHAAGLDLYRWLLDMQERMPSFIKAVKAKLGQD